jgi:hypothetical protein
MKERSKKKISIPTFAEVSAACVIAAISIADGRADDACPIFGVKIPVGYRQWGMVAVAHETGFDELRSLEK